MGKCKCPVPKLLPGTVPLECCHLFKSGIIQKTAKPWNSVETVYL